MKYRMTELEKRQLRQWLWVGLAALAGLIAGLTAGVALALGA